MYHMCVNTHVYHMCVITHMQQACPINERSVSPQFSAPILLHDKSMYSEEVQDESKIIVWASCRWMSRVARGKESCHTHEGATSHTWMSHEARVLMNQYAKTKKKHQKKILYNVIFRRSYSSIFHLAAHTSIITRTYQEFWGRKQRKGRKGEGESRGGGRLCCWLEQNSFWMQVIPAEIEKQSIISMLRLY